MLSMLLASFIFGCLTPKLTCRYGAQRNSGQVQRFVICLVLQPYFHLAVNMLCKFNSETFSC